MSTTTPIQHAHVPRWTTTDDGLIIPETPGGMLVPPPDCGSIDFTYCDPPWDVYQKGKHGAAEHYDLMTLERIHGMGEAIKYLASENSFCFMWVTNASLPYGAQILEDSGFTYKRFYVWIKPRFTLGGYFRNAAELLLIGAKGKGTKFVYRSQPNWGMYPLQEHSRKPEEIHTIIARVCGPGTYLELFARRPSTTASHWHVWGNEVDSTISLARWGYPVPSDITPRSAGPDATDHDDPARSEFLLPCEDLAKATELVERSNNKQNLVEALVAVLSKSEVETMLAALDSPETSS